MNLSSAHHHPLREDSDGVIRLGSTRVTLESVVALYEQGASPEEIALRFSSLSLAGVYGTLSFYLTHAAELRSYLHGQRAAAAADRAQAADGVTELRERLRRRRDS